MNDIFGKANREVKPHTAWITDKSKYADVSQIVRAKQELERQASIVTENALDDRLAKIEKDFDAAQLKEAVSTRQLSASQNIKKLNKLTENGKATLLTNIVFEVFSKALLLDEDFVTEHTSELYTLVESYVNTNGGFKLLTEAVAQSNSVLLKRVKTLCENIVTEVCKRKIKTSKATEDADVFEFGLDEEEENEFSKGKGELNLDQIADLVKQKVLNVVLDEKSREKRKEELQSDIEQELSVDDGVVDDESVREALNKIMLNTVKLNEGTLWNSLFKNVYMETLKENQAIIQSDHARAEDKNDDALTYRVNQTIKQLNDSEDEDSVLDPDNYDIEHEEINMDMMLTETLTQYTLLEALNTLKLETFTRKNIKELTEKLLNTR